MQAVKRRRGQRGVGRTSKDLLEAAIAVAEQCQPIGVRGVAYKLFVAGKIVSMSKGEVAKVGLRLKFARERGLMPWEWIVDDSRQINRVRSWHDLRGFAETIQWSYRKDFWITQDYRVQVWSEKGTVGGVIRPVTQKYGVGFMPVHGFASATVVHDLARASVADGRQMVVIYVGDHDPSGMHMSEVDLPARADEYGGKVIFRRVALVAEDLPGLPSFPSRDKEDDKRYPWYQARYGSEAWELDAMDPNVLRARIEAAIKDYIEPEAWYRTQLVEEAELATVQKVARAMSGQAEEAHE